MVENQQISIKLAKCKGNKKIRVLCIISSLLHAVVLAAQLCLTLCDLEDYSLPGSSVHSSGKNTGVGCRSLLQGIFQPKD